jgi:hypothetical protein
MFVPGIDTLDGLAPAHPRQSARLFAGPPRRPDRELADMQEWPLRSYLELQAVPASVRVARLHAKSVLCEWRMGALADTAELIVSEITTNAVRASAAIAGRRDETGQAPPAPQMRLWLTSDRHNVLIQVWDDDPRLPACQDPAPDAEAGRGLLIIEAVSAQWGCCTRDGQGGKIIWAVCAREAGTTA